MDSTRADKKQEFLNSQAKFILSNGFDSVRIFATKYEPDEYRTFTFNAGDGNIQAQTGSVREWLIRMDQFVVEDAKKRVREPE